MTKTVCDICGEEMATIKFADHIEDQNFCISSHGKIWDICNECRASLNRWMTIRRQKGEDDETKSHNTDIENSATKHWIFERVESNSTNPNLWDFKLRCPNCFTESTFVSQNRFVIYPYSEKHKCPVCGESFIFDAEDMLK